MIILFSCLFGFGAWAGHPDIKYLTISNVEYSCHPVDSPQYCPSIYHDVPLSVRISFERLNCLDSIDKANPNIKAQIKECFLNSRLQKFYEDLQLYDVKTSCLKENLKACSSYDLTCADAPCGDLGSFIKELKKRNLNGFEKADGDEACNSLLQ